MASTYVRDIKKDLAKKSVLIRIISILREKPMSISELQRTINMKRGTLIYYLKELESQGFLKKERVEKKKTGRPTMLIFDEKAWKKEGEELDKKMKGREQELDERISNLPEVKIMLGVIQGCEIELKDLMNHKDIFNMVRKYQVLSWLYEKGLIKEMFSLTPEGKKFLKEHK